MNFSFRVSNRDAMTHLKRKFAYFSIFFTESFKLRTSSLFLTGFLMKFLKRKVQVISFLTNSKGAKILFFKAFVELSASKGDIRVCNKLYNNHLPQASEKIV